MHAECQLDVLTELFRLQRITNAFEILEWMPHAMPVEQKNQYAFRSAHGPRWMSKTLDDPANACRDYLELCRNSRRGNGSPSSLIDSIDGLFIHRCRSPRHRSQETGVLGMLDAGEDRCLKTTDIHVAR